MTEKAISLDPKLVAAEYLDRIEWALSVVKDRQMADAVGLAGLVDVLKRGTTLSEEECRVYALEQVRSR